MSSQQGNCESNAQTCNVHCNKSTALCPYLTFPGNASEALDFYASVFGGKTEKHKFSDCPSENQCEASKDKILHASLHFDGNCIMLADVCAKTSTYTIGNAIHLNICMTNSGEMNKVFALLSEGGVVEKPLHHHFWGATYGKVVDKFGILWGLHCKDEVKPSEPSFSQSSCVSNKQ